MAEFAFSLNATMPIFLLMLVGAILRRCGMIDEVFVSRINDYVFKVAIPVLLFGNLAPLDLKDSWQGDFVGFCFAATLGSIAIVLALSMLYRHASFRGEFVQAAYRSSASLLGVALVQNLYGTAEIAPLMLIGSVPLYNITAVVVLETMQARNTDTTSPVDVAGIVRDTARNPIIAGCVFGVIWSALHLAYPEILGKTVSYIGGTATPLGLIAMGAAFELDRALDTHGPALFAAVIKLVGLVAIFLPAAVALGFRGQKLIAILVMLGSATTVSAYVMATKMGHDGFLSASVVALTTLFSSFTLTSWIWLLRALMLV